MKKHYIMTVIFADGTHLNPVIRMTEKGMSDYANKMFRKYWNMKGQEFAEGMRVEAGYFDENMEWHLVNTWAA